MKGLLASFMIAIMMLGGTYEYVGGENVQMISQLQWGSKKLYPDYSLKYNWDPQYIVVHWGGMTRERATKALAIQTLRGWQSYHLRKGWQDIAYNYAIDELGNMYRLRGENHSGATSGKDPHGQPWNDVAVNIVWIGGKSDADGPSALAKARLAEYVEERGLPLLGHQETGKATQCPGPDWLEFAQDYRDGLYSTEEGMHKIQWHQFIDALFEGSVEFQGSADYWKQLAPDHWEWRNFWNAYKKMIA